MTAEQVIQRARSAIGHGCAYKLGMGGYNPSAVWPWNSRGECDCTGFLAWCLGLSRQTDNPWYEKMNGGWLESTAIVRDCATPYGFFDLVRWEQAAIGDVLAYPDRGTKQGHVGIVSAVDATGPTQAIHCSSGNWRTREDAIQETGVGLWRLAEAIVARSAFLEGS